MDRTGTLSPRSYSIKGSLDVPLGSGLLHTTTATPFTFPTGQKTYSFNLNVQITV